MDTGEAAGKERWFMCELCFLSEGVGWVEGVERGRDEGNSLRTTDESRVRFVWCVVVSLG